MSEKYTFWVTLRPQSDRCCQGEAEVYILDFKTTWLELKKPCQTAAMQGKAEHRIYNIQAHQLIHTLGSNLIIMNDLADI